MSHLIKSDTCMQDLKKVFYKLVKNDGNLDYTTIVKTLEILIPRDSNGNYLIDYNQSNYSKSLEFSYNHNTIFISTSNFDKMVNEIVNQNILNFKSEIEIEEFEKVNLRIYFYLYWICYELELGVQSLIAQNMYPVPSPLISNAYYEIYNFLNNCDTSNFYKKVKNFILLYNFNKNQNIYLLNRNASIESSDLLEKFTLYMNDDLMNYVFKKTKDDNCVIGYDGRFSCPLEETYNAIGMGSKYKKMNLENNLSDDDKIRYGLPISSELKKLVLAKKS